MTDTPRRPVPVRRAWAMPNAETFSVPPIGEVVRRYTQQIAPMLKWIDPFARNTQYASVTNDLNPDTLADHHMDALDFLKMFDADSVGGVLFDPPYSPRQITECYQAVGMDTQGGTMTRASFWGDLKREIGRIVHSGGYAITCGWNSGGIGEANGVELIEVLMVAHGGWHNDTIVTVERRVPPSGQMSFA